MKKIIFGILALAAGFFASCSNDDIEIISQSDFKLNISTQKMYDTFGISDYIKDRFLSSSNTYTVGIFTFIYDDNGNLVNSKTSFEQTFGNVSQNFILNNGSYKAVVIEMLVDKSENYESDFFKIIGTEKISTLEIAYKKTTKVAYWYGAVGLSSTTFSTSSNSVSITPKAIGTILNSYYFNFDQAKHTFLATYTKNAPQGRYCNPNLSGDERFHYGSYTAENTWVRRGYYSSDSGFDSEESISPYFIEEGSFITCITATTPKEDGTISFKAYPSENTKVNFVDGSEIYAGLYYTGAASGADCVGSFFKSFSEIEVWYKEQKSKYSQTTKIIQPVTTWGSSVSTVQSVMKNYTLTVGSVGKAVLQENQKYAIAYEGNGGAEEEIDYWFDKETTGLYESDCIYDSSKYPLSGLKATLDEVFTMAGSEENMYYYMSSDGKTGILLLSSDGYNIICWFDVSAAGGAHSRKDMMMQKAKSVSLRLLNK